MVNQVVLPRKDSDSTFPESRIVRIDGPPERRSVWLFRLQGEGRLPLQRPLAELELEIEQGLVNLDVWSPQSAFIQESHLKPFQKFSRDAAKKIISALKERSPNFDELFIKSSRGPLIKAVALKLDIERVEVHRAIFRWWRNGMTEQALVPPNGFSNKGQKSKEGQKRRGRKVIGVSATCLTDEVTKCVQKTILYEVAAEQGKEGLFRKVLIALGSEKKEPSGRRIIELPPPERAISRRQFDRIYNELNADGSLDRRRQGLISWDLEHSTSLYNAHDQLSGPASEYQTDDTGSQVEIIDPTGQPIGTAFIILTICTWSNLITGFHADLGASTEEAYALAFYNSIIDKVSFCKYYGIEITKEEWPAAGIPIRYHSDNGSAYSSDRTSSYVISIPINLSCARSHHGNAKGDVENKNKYIKSNLLRYLVGYRRKAGQQRGTGNPKKRAALTLYELRVLIIRWILLQNNTKPLSENAVPTVAKINKVMPTANALWTWGVKNIGAPLHAVSDKELWLRFLPERDVRITHHGIEYRRFTYTCAKFEKERVFHRAKNAPFVMRARVDDARPDLLYLHDKRTGEFIVCERIRTSDDIVTWTHADANAMHEHHKTAAASLEKGFLQGSVQNMADIDTVNAKAENRAKDRGAQKTSKKSVSESRDAEQHRLRRSDKSASYDAYSKPAKKPSRRKRDDIFTPHIDNDLEDILTKAFRP